MKTMKNTMYVMLIALALIFTATSCNKDDDGGDGGNAAAGTVKAKVDGSNFTSNAQTTNATLVNASGSSSLSIFGSDLGGKTIQINIIGGYNGEGTYDIGGGANVMVNASYSEGNASGVVEVWQAPFDDTVAGEVNISESSATKVVGTFSFSGKNVNGDNSTKVISEGSFNLNL